MKHTGKTFQRATMVLLASLFASSILAPASAADIPMLGEILSKVEANYQQIQAFTAVFRQTTTSSAAGTMTPSEAVGRLYYAKPRQMRWEYEKPEVQVFVANNQYAWLYIPSESQVSLFDAKKLFASPLAQTFFDGAVGLKNHFDVTLESTRSNKSTAVLKLVPKQEDPSIKLLHLWIDLQSFRITRIESQDLLGNTNRIVLESLSPLPTLDHRLFHMEIPQATHVFDAEGHELSPVAVEQIKSNIATGKH